MDKNFAIFLLNKVRDDYNTISKHFSETRQGLPKEYHSLAEYVKNGDKVLDIGCGNGRFLYALYHKNADYCGIDASEEMIESAKLKFPKAKFLRADALDLPFEDIYYPWKDQEGNVTADRYVHCFTARELKNLAKSAGFKIIKIWKNGQGIKSNISL